MGIRSGYEKFKLWSVAKIWDSLMCLRFSLGRRRMSHNNGVAAKGTVKIVDDPEFPEHPFFVAGREFGCRVRHGAAKFMDDMMRLVWSCSIKFEDADYKSPFDVLMNTGKISFFWDAYHFFEFAFHRFEKKGIEYRYYYDKYPEGAKAAADGLRRAPSSLAHLYFHSQTIMRWDAKDGKVRYCRLRSIPADRRAESGLPSWENGEPTPDQISDQRVLESETRHRNWLKDEWLQRVQDEGVEYLLQMQLYEPGEGEMPEDYNPECLNVSKEWDESEHPWMDLARIRLTEPLSYRDTVCTSFSIRNYPEGMSILPARSMADYNSVNYFRAHRRMERWSRLAMIKIFGLPKQYPDEGPRNYRAPFT